MRNSVVFTLFVIQTSYERDLSSSSVIQSPVVYSLRSIRDFETVYAIASNRAAI